jgi:hypothetical protein
MLVVITEPRFDDRRINGFWEGLIPCYTKDLINNQFWLGYLLPLLTLTLNSIKDGSESIIKGNTSGSIYCSVAGFVSMVMNLQISYEADNFWTISVSRKILVRVGIDPWVTTQDIILLLHFILLVTWPKWDTSAVICTRESWRDRQGAGKWKKLLVIVRT